MAAPKAQTNQQPLQLYRGVVKQVQSGDCVIIRSLAARDRKPLEKQLMLSNISAPRLARRANPNSADSANENDQPYAFEAREFLRKKLVGKEICFVKDANSTTVDRGTLFLGRDPQTGENMNEAIIKAGLAEVRRMNKPSEEETRLVALEDQAKSQGLGKWSKDPETNHVRNIKYNIENASNFVDSFRQKPIDAIVEYVRDGSTLRLLLLPSYHHITVQLSGLKCPGFKREADNTETPEPFAEEAKQYVEERLLQQDVRVILEGVANQSNGILLGSILHPNGNISEFLLKEGLAKCVDWSMGVVTGGAEKYRAAEKQAKQARQRLWKNYTQASINTDESNRNFAGKVVEVLNGDGLVVKLNDGSFKKIFLSSIRPPRSADFPNLPAKSEKKGNALYEVPYLYDAREFLRKKLIGKKVNCTVDYIQPKSDEYPEKICCTVMFADTNVAEAIVSQGLAKVIRYRQDDDQRSSRYDELLAAEARAQKKLAGIHSNKEPVLPKISDVSSDVNKAKQFLPILQRSGRCDGVVEFVSSGSRLRVYLPKESCMITLLLAGIDCPRLGRPASAQGPAQPSDQFAEEAYAYSKGLTFQHEVKVEVESVDRVGNFIGQVISSEGVNLSVGLVEQGYASVYKSSAAGNSAFFAALSNAEQKAKDLKLNRWKNYVEEKIVPEEVDKNEPQERVVALKKLVITEIKPDLHFYAQSVESGQKLEQLTNQLRAELASKPPVPGAYTPKVGDICVAKFSLDDEWYRAKVISTSSNSQATVLFIDYGNTEKLQSTRLAAIPAGFDTLPGQAHEFALAFVQLSSDEDDNEAALYAFRSLVADSGDSAEFTYNIEYKSGTVDFVTLLDAKNVDIGKHLVAEGFVSLDRARKEKRLQKLLAEYQKILNAAKAGHKNMWRYGDKEQDDAAEFGFRR